MKTIFKLFAALIAITLFTFSSAQAASSVIYYHHDALGSIIATSGQNGSVRLPNRYHNFFDQILTRNKGIYRNCQSGGYSMKAIADAIDLHYSTVSEIIKGYENS